MTPSKLQVFWRNSYVLVWKINKDLLIWRHYESNQYWCICTYYKVMSFLACAELQILQDKTTFYCFNPPFKICKQYWSQKFYWFRSFSSLAKYKSLWQWIGGGNLHEDQCSTLPGIFIQGLKYHREYYQKFIFENVSKYVKIIELWVIEKANIYSIKQKNKK